VSKPDLATVLAAIDAANAADPNRVAVEGEERPAERVYGERMSETLALLHPDASEHLQIAARGQHIERWTKPRRSYPEGRVGYLKWRKALMDYHAGRLGEIMRQAGYEESDVARVGALVRKERIKYDAEAQALEDVICVVFLKHYFAEFAAKHEDAKIIDIVRKTWSKMSPKGHAAALALKLPGGAGRLVEAALAGSPAD
jgi:Domain of unknown function (DUF4202)